MLPAPPPLAGFLRGTAWRGPARSARARAVPLRGAGGEGRCVCGGVELLEAEGNLLEVELSLRELKSSGLSLNIVFSFPKCHVLSSHWPGKEGNTTATWR